ncbi:stathmin-1-A isoform X2 [Diaphorina citri]|uniref:Stathmin n=1 Tax=Diaphorina citri TaxID=121845 RepID=A0A1S3CUM1_DIACI|nr:stathmin-1-A isoform X2 [Diaphorina citri]
MADTSATEIRCEEKSKGGIKYDVILAEPAGTPPPLKTAADTPVILRSESIEEKLKQAEERRLSLEAEKIAKNAARRSKIEDAAKKRDEKENEFIEQTKETLEKRLEISSEKREALINDKMEKLKDHDRRVEEARLKKEKLGDSKENGCEVTTPSG